MFPDLMSFYFSSNIQIIDPEIRINFCLSTSCLMLVFQAVVAAGGVMVWETFAWHSLNSLLPTEHCSNSKIYLVYIVVGHVHHDNKLAVL